MLSLLLDSVDAVVLQSVPSSQPLETQIRKCVLGECECAYKHEYMCIGVNFSSQQNLERILTVKCIFESESSLFLLQLWYF